MLEGLVSVVIPTHNRSAILRKAIESVIAQTYSDVEIIIVDDASTDNTKEVIESFNYDKIKYFYNNTSLGATGARNKGIENSFGEFVAFLDDDDIWYKNKLELQVKLFQNPLVGLVYSSIELFFEQYNISYNTSPSKKGSIYKDMLIQNCVGGTVSAIVRKKALLESGFFDTIFPAREEYDLWIRISKNWEIDFIPKPLVKAYYRTNLVRISSNLDSYIKAIELINLKFKTEIEQTLNEKEKKRKKIDQNFFLGSQAIKINHSKLARKYFLRAFLVNFNFRPFIPYLLSFFGIRTVIMFKYLSTKLNRKIN